MISLLAFLTMFCTKLLTFITKPLLFFIIFDKESSTMAFLVISVEVSCFPFKFQFTPQHWCSCTPHYSLYFPMELTRRICLTIRSFLNYRSFPLFSWPLHLTQGWYCKEKLEASHSYSWTNISSWYLLLTKGKQKNCSAFRKTNLKQSLLTFLHPFLFL